MTLYQPLFEGPIDIIGDVHGEITALEHLLKRLGYSASGYHPQGRRLVFLGDLVDRGPDSPAVVEMVMKLVKAGVAQCILGNHELNILLNRPMHGNGWIVQPNTKEKTDELDSNLSEPERRAGYIAFFASLPVVLENDAMRVVHACWDDQAVAAIKQAGSSDAASLYAQFKQQYTDTINEPAFSAALAQESEQYAEIIRNQELQPPLLVNMAKRDVLEQTLNPLRVLTTSSMVVADQPYFGGGKWRMAERDAWWDQYSHHKPVVIGHFWRQFSKLDDRMQGVFGRDLFANIEPHAWMGKKKNVYCIDYSVGQRHIERKKKSIDTYYGRLAALRLPEREVMHDDGSVVKTY